MPHQINAAQKIISLTQDPEEGCNISRCKAQCVDSTCYSKMFEQGMILNFPHDLRVLDELKK